MIDALFHDLNDFHLAKKNKLFQENTDQNPTTPEPKKYGTGLVVTNDL